MKQIITLLVAIFLVASIANSAEKRCLLEIHTGAWCGWCPGGTVVLDELQAANPGKIIGVKYHQKDGMQLDDGVRMYQFFVGTGVPTGSVDRIPWDAGTGNTIIMLGTNNWKQTTDIILGSEALADVSLSWKFNEGTQKITGTVSCTILKDLAAQLAFQVLICENNVTGSGSKFDQKNYFSGNADYKTHPYYDKPATMVGYVHNNVGRAVLGGVSGETSKFPATVKVGETYKWDFMTDVPTVPAGGGAPVKMADVYLVGVVGQSLQNNVFPILNCALGGGSSKESSLSVDGDPVAYTATGQQATFKFTLDNQLTDDKTYNLTIVKEDLSPDGWLAQVVGGKKSITVKKGAKSTLSMDVFPGENIGNGRYRLVATDALNANSKLEASIEVVHTGAERLYIYSPMDDYDGLNALLPQTAYDKFSSISISKIGDLTKLQGILAKFNKVKTAVISCADNFTFSATDIALVQYYHSSGVDILLDGSIALGNKDVQTYLNTTFGFGATKQFKILNNDQEMPIEGISGDPITNGFLSSLTPDKYYPTSFNITNTAKAQKVFVYTDSKADIAGIRCDNNGAKIVALGFAFANMTDDQQRLELLEKSLYWLENEVASLKPAITVDKTALEFGNTEVNSTNAKTVTITNTGKADLNIEGFNFTGADASSFSYVPMTFPQVVKPNDNLVAMVKFVPTTEKACVAKLNILSDDPDKAEVSVDLTGTGTASSVQTDAGFVCNVSLTPNPVTTSSEVSYTTTGTVNALIRIIDAQGKVVAEVYNGLLNSGNYNYTLNTNNLSSGNYFITAEFDGKFETVPFVIVK